MDKLFVVLFVLVLVWMTFGAMFSMSVFHLCRQLGFGGGAVNGVYAPYCYAAGSRRHVPLGMIIK